MRLVDQIRSVRHTFDSNRGRTALTLVGIMIGAGSIVLLASLLAGGQEALLDHDQEATGSDVVQVDSDEVPVKQTQKTRRELSHNDDRALGSSPVLPGAHVTSEKDRWTMAYFHKLKKRTALTGVEPVALSLHRIAVAAGRFINADDVTNGTRVCVIGANVGHELFDGASPLGQPITVDGVQWIVVGVLANKPGFGGGDGPWMWNSKILVPRTTFDAVFNNQHTVDNIYVRIADGAAPLPTRIDLARRIVDSSLLRSHYGVQNFKVDRESQDEEQFNTIISVIKILMLGTGLLSLFVGGINIMNIMLVTVTERTREIGVRRAIGANPTSIMMQFLLESAVIALAGGLIGVLGGLGLSWVTAKYLTYKLGSWSMHVEPWSIALGLGLSVTTGVIFGMFPAWRASKLDPVEALRYE